MSGELPPLLVVSPLEEVLPNSSGLFSKDQGSGQDGTVTGFTGSWRGRRNGSWETEERHESVGERKKKSRLEIGQKGRF